MKTFWTLLAALLPAISHAAIIQYDFSKTWIYSDATSTTYLAQSSFVIDTTSSMLVSASIDSDLVTGHSKEPVPITFEFAEANAPYLAETDIWFVMFYVDLETTDASVSSIGASPYPIVVPQGENPFYYLTSDDGGIMELVVNGEGYWVSPVGGTLTVISPDASVPEPTTLALLSLGLALTQVFRKKPQ